MFHDPKHYLKEKSKIKADEAIRLAKNGDYESAIQANEECIKLKESISDSYGVGMAHKRLAFVYLDVHNLEGDKNKKLSWAKKTYSAALKAWELNIRDEYVRKKIIVGADWCGTHLSSAEDYKKAETYLLESIAYNELENGSIVDSKSLSFSCHKLAFIYNKYALECDVLSQQLKHYTKAYDYAMWGASCKEKVGRTSAIRLLVRISHRYALCLEKDGQMEKSMDVLKGNLRFIREIKDEGEILTLDKLASMYFRSRRLHRALDRFEEVLALKGIIGKQGYDHSRHALAQVCTELAGQHNTNRDYDKAVRYYEKAAALSELNLDSRKVAENRLRLGFVYFHMGEYEVAANYFHDNYIKYCDLISLREGKEFLETINIDVKNDIELANNFFLKGENQKAAQLYMRCFDEILSVSNELRKRKIIDNSHVQALKKMKQVAKVEGFTTEVSYDDGTNNGREDKNDLPSLAEHFVMSVTK